MMILLIGGRQRSGTTLLRHLCDDLKLRMQVDAEPRTVVESRSGDLQRTYDLGPAGASPRPG
jgi:hypothetical protein